MTETYDVLGQVFPSNQSETVLYTVPATTQAISSSIVVCNITTGTAKFRIRVKKTAAGDNDKEWIYYDVSVGPNDSYIAVIGITLNVGGSIKVRSDTGSALAFTLFGVEIT
jgi:hypothetical protein